MEDRPRAHNRLGPKEQVLDLQEIAIAQDRLQRRDLGVGAQHEDSVEPRFLGELAGVDLEHLAPFGFLRLAQIASIGRVSDQRLVAFLQLRIERSDNRLAIPTVLFGLRFVAADDVTLAFDLDLFDEELGLADLALHQQRVGASEGCDDGLANGAVDALVLDDLDVGRRSSGMPGRGKFIWPSASGGLEWRPKSAS